MASSYRVVGWRTDLISLCSQSWIILPSLKQDVADNIDEDEEMMREGLAEATGRCAAVRFLVQLDT